MGLFNFLGDLIGEIFNALAKGTTKATIAYDSSYRMSDDKLKERMTNTSDNFERAGYYKRYKENHPEIYGDKKDK